MTSVADGFFPAVFSASVGRERSYPEEVSAVERLQKVLDVLEKHLSWRDAGTSRAAPSPSSA